MRYFFSILTIVIVVMSGFSAFTADKVVVIPLDSSSSGGSNTVIGYYAISNGSYTSGNGYFVSSETVTLPADGTCAVTVTADVYHLRAE